MPTHPLAFLRLPYGLLMALDSRMLHFWMQPTHYLVRLVHILSMSLFFGITVMIDVGLLNRSSAERLRVLGGLALPWLHGSFTVAIVTGLALFFYDPVHVGSHAYFAPKLIFIVLALLNATAGHRLVYRQGLFGGAAITGRGRWIALMSLFSWTAVVVCSCLNTEAMPKVFLR